MTPRVLICGNIVWAHEELTDLLGSVAEIVHMHSTTRADFLADLRPTTGKYSGIIGVYRHPSSTNAIGVFDREIIAALAPTVKWIAHNGSGYDQIDIEACKEHGIRVSNTPEAVNEATATTALYLIISTVRQFSHGERSLRAGTWKSPTTARHARDLSALTLSVIGLGGIGLRLAEMAHVFPMRVLYYSRRPVPTAPEWCEYFEDVEAMLSQTDVLSVHVPYREDTHGLVGEKWIRCLKKGAIVINTARGKVVDEDALLRGLEDGHLSSVGLDVYPEEPAVNPRLLQFPRVVLVPHMGTENKDTQRKMEVKALTNLRDFLTKGAGSDLIPEMR